MEGRFADLETEVVRLRKKTFSPENHDSFHLFSGYVDTLINRKLLFKIYGRLSRLGLELYENGLIGNQKNSKEQWFAFSDEDIEELREMSSKRRKEKRKE